jgi:Tol biopolymer transport system component
MPLLDWVIETPQIQCTHRRRALPSTKFRSVPIAGGNPEKLLFAQDVESVAVASHGNRLAFAQVHHPGNVWQLRLASPIKAEARATKLISSTRGDSGASVSPDSKHIAFQSWRSGNPELWVSDRDGSSPVQLTSFRGPSIGEPRWSPDSRQIVSDLRPSSGKPELYLMNLEGGPPQRFFTGTTRAASPFWSRDGNWIYFDSDQPHAIWKAPVKGGKPIRLTDEGQDRNSPQEAIDGTRVFFYKGEHFWSVSADGCDERLIPGCVCYADIWGLTRPGNIPAPSLKIRHSLDWRGEARFL